MKITEKEGKKVVTLGGTIAFNARDNSHRIKELHDELMHQYQRRDQFLEIDRILRSLSRTWYDRDIYRSNMLCWYQKDNQNVYIRELLPDDIQLFAGTNEEWSAYHRSLNNPELQQRFLHPSDVVVDFAEVDHTKCPQCTTKHVPSLLPVIKCIEYRPTEEQRWQTRLLVICRSCEKAQVIIQQPICAK